ncbi:hypothetical protein ACHAWX_007075 [Stephanocyclus meneghinianus]
MASPPTIHVQTKTFNLLMAFVFILCICNVTLVFWAVERDLVQSVASHIDLKNGVQRLMKQIKQARRENLLTAAQARNLTDDEQHHALHILVDAGVDLTEDVVKKLPRISDIYSQYGHTPIIRNLESCKRFRELVPKNQRLMAVAGMFNTGTNILGNLIVHNCAIAGRKKGTGMRQQVPWGKHNPPTTHRLKHKSKVGGEGVNQSAVFPLVIIKDPYHWAISQCRHKYFTFWEHDAENCPNIMNVWDEEPTDVTVEYATTLGKYETLIGLWNDWYNEYEREASKYPIAYVRFEDVLFHAEHVVTTVCSCVGGHITNKGKFRYLEQSAKVNNGTHAGANGLVSSILRYGNPKLRLEGWTKLDYDYTQEHLDQDLMDKYGYIRPVWNRE